MELGQIGVWSGLLRRMDEAEAVKMVVELEKLGYGTIWVSGGRGTGIFDRVRAFLGATSRVVIATGIISIWEQPAEEVAAECHAIEMAYPGRFLLGLGVSHGRDKTYDALTAFLDTLDHAPNPVPQEQRVLSALGPRMLRLARDRAWGSHPYNVPISHTQHAREILDTAPLLAPEQAVILESDPAQARQIARKFLDFYLGAPNYTNNFEREGFTEADIANGGSDRLIDALVAWGDLSIIRARIDAHLQAGANHVCLQVVTADRESFPLAEYQQLAALIS